MSRTFNRCVAMLLLGLPILSSAQTTIYVPGGTTGIGNNTVNGNVGVGTSSPLGKLEISYIHGSYFRQVLPTVANGGGTGDAGFYMWISEPGWSWTGAGIGRNIFNSGVWGQRVNPNLTAQMMQFREDSTIAFSIWDAAGNGYNPLTLTNNNALFLGNVGIGTTNPSHKLSVNGTIRAKEVIVESGWADYVFADDYRLASLTEVEAHIKAHRHLPGIPSAAEVANQGVGLGEMQALLLAKIEELTLHLIAQEKRSREQLQAQQQEITALCAEVVRLGSQ